MGNNRREQNKGSDPKGVVGAVIVLFFVLLSSIGDGAGVVLLILLLGFVAAGIGIAIAASNKKKADSAAAKPKSGTYTREHTQREFKPAHFDLGKLVKNAENSVSKRLTEQMREDTSECADDHEHVEPDFRADPDEKRAHQLKEFLRNGLIEKEEYNILMRKYGLK